MIDKLAFAFNVLADDMDTVAAKFGNVIALSPTGLLIVCTLVFALAGLVVYSSHKRKTDN